MLVALFYGKDDEIIEIKTMPFRGEDIEPETIKVEKEESA